MRIYKIVVLLLMLSLKCAAQVIAPNIGFENGTFDRWQCSVGTIDTLGNIVVFPGSASPGVFTMYDDKYAKVTDLAGDFPVFTPNRSKHSIMMGNNLQGNAVQRISYTLHVPASGANSVLFDYAVVLQNPGHPAHQQPRFTLRVFDVDDNRYLDCPSFDFSAPGDLPGFKQGANDIFYKDWSTANIDLRNYNGKTLRLEFTVNHCPFGAHFCYVYLDVNENISTSINGNAYCNSQRAVTLTAPSGFANYTWYTADMTRQVGTGQALKISPAPADGTKYAVRISPYNGLGCIDTLFTIVNKIDNGFNLSVVDAINSCPGSVVDITAAYVTAGSSSGMKLDYYADSLGTNYLTFPDHITKSGSYYIRGTNADGCTNLLKIKVNLGLPVINITDPPPVLYPVTVDLSKTFTPEPGIQYTYFHDAAATVPIPNYTAVAKGGIYYIKGTSPAGCSSMQPVNVSITIPPFSVTAPNTFTPNNDGINDNFILTVKGFITFSSLRIYSRSGALIFTAKSPTEFWNGNYNGQTLPVGTYYWIFEGIDNYDNKKINQAASITLIR